jgi:hypothetical protein
MFGDQRSRELGGEISSCPQFSPISLCPPQFPPIHPLFTNSKFDIKGMAKAQT